MSSYPLISRAAQREIDDAADWYESQQTHLGIEFESAVQRVLAEIAANPRRYAVEFRGVRGAQVPEFPYYCVYYRLVSTRVEVLSVFHSSRDPAVWQSRV